MASASADNVAAAAGPTGPRLLLHGPVAHLDARDPEELGVPVWLDAGEGTTFTVRGPL